MRNWVDRNQLLVLSVATAIFLASFLLLRLLEDEPPSIELGLESEVPDGTPIRVHVTGAVTSPGVYELRSGDRVIDALDAAGGAAAGADIDGLNLARRVHDAEQLVVPRRSGASPVVTLLQGELLDINAATEAQLDLLPGIGEAYSRRIVDSRLVDGPFRAIEELVVRRVLPQATFERVKDLILVKP